MAYKYYVFHFKCDYTDEDISIALMIDKGEDELAILNDLAEEYAQSYGESYEYLVTGWDDDEIEDKEEREEALEAYYSNCICTWEEISYEEYLEYL